MLWILISAFVLSFVVSFGLGANDGLPRLNKVLIFYTLVANAFATSVGSKTISLRNACIVAAVAELLGAILLGANVTTKISSGIVGSLDSYTYCLGMLATLFSVGVWLVLASCLGLPVSATHAVVAAIVGFGLVAGGNSIKWGGMIDIGISWIVSPLAAGLLGVAIFLLKRKFILERLNSFDVACKFVPFIYSITLAINLLPVSYKVALTIAPHLGDISWAIAAGVSIASCVITFVVVSIYFLPKVRRKILEEFGDAKPQMRSRTIEQQMTEKVFCSLQILAAIFTSFVHGANDVSNAVGPLHGIYFAYNETSEDQPPIWMLFYGGVGIVIGLALLGSKVMKTLGKELTPMSPSKGFSIELGSALTVLISTVAHFPVSSTHCKVGAIIAVGFFANEKNINWRICLSIVLSWIVTIPFAGLFTALVFFLLRLIP